MVTGSIFLAIILTNIILATYAWIKRDTALSRRSIRVSLALAAAMMVAASLHVGMEVLK